MKINKLFKKNKKNKKRTYKQGTECEKFRKGIFVPEELHSKLTTIKKHNKLATYGDVINMLLDSYKGGNT